MNPVVEVEGLRKTYRSPAAGWGLLGGRREVTVLDSVDFALGEGELAALVGESGSGKTTLARCLMGLIPFEAGRLRVAGYEVGRVGGRRRRDFRRAAQIVFQNPYASLNPALQVRSLIQEAVKVHRDLPRAEVSREVDRLADLVLLPRERLGELPASLSGGERRRVAFARALATRPRFVVADEPVSGVDPPIQVQLIELVRRVHRRRGVTFLLISHDLRVARSLATRVLVLYRGQIVEDAPAQAFFGGDARHPYSRDLLRSGFEAARCLRERDDTGPRPEEPGGCRFRHRCSLVDSSAPCATLQPPLAQAGALHRVACHRWDAS